MVESVKPGKKVAGILPLSPPIKALAGGPTLGALAFLTVPRFLGFSLETIEYALRGGAVPRYASAVKSVFISITLNFGGSGGIVTPIFFVGATSRTLFAQSPGCRPRPLQLSGWSPFWRVRPTPRSPLRSWRSRCPDPLSDPTRPWRA